MSTEANVQIEIPRTGQKIRNLSVSAVQSDGTVATVLMQVVSLADADGNLLTFGSQRQFDDLLVVMKDVRGLLKLLLGALTTVAVGRDNLADL